ncbi:MAG: hypothetical protein RI894_500, partial [Bacteroidota bacterium]
QSNLFYQQNNIPILLYKKCYINFIHQQDLYELTYDLEEVSAQTMFWFNNDPNAYNVHFVHSSQSASGRAAGIVSNSCYLSAVQAVEEMDMGISTNYNIPITLLVHELGHCFGLFHTHDCEGGGLWSGLPSDNHSDHCSQCDQEPVSRTRLQNGWCDPFSIDVQQCQVTGDFLCDTRATPELSSLVNRYTNNYTGEGGTDHWGDSWNPQTDNVMAYSYWWFKKSFTPLQIGVMLQYLGDRNFVSCNSNYSIAGPSSICSSENQAYTINIPNGRSFNWILSRNENPDVQIVSQTATSVVIHSSSTVNSTTNLLAIPTSCDDNPVSFTIDISEPNPTGSIACNSQITRGANSIQTLNFYPAVGYLNWYFPPGWSIIGCEHCSTIRVLIGPNAITGHVGADGGACGLHAQRDVLVRTETGGLTCIPLYDGATESVIDENVPTIELATDNSTDQLRIQIDGTNETYSAKIYDIYSSNLVKQMNVSNVSTHDISDLQTGVYVARFNVPNCPFGLRFIKY